MPRCIVCLRPGQKIAAKGVCPQCYMSRRRAQQRARQVEVAPPAGKFDWYAAALGDPRIVAKLELVERRSDGCAMWVGGHANQAGYGLIYWQGKTLTAHRLQAVRHGRATAEDECVMHSCDRPGCIEPEHLRGATHQENAWDSRDKGRRPKPKGNPWGRAGKPKNLDPAKV